MFADEVVHRRAEDSVQLVFGEGEAVAAALSIVVPDGGTPPNVLAPAVQATARAVSRNLGFRADVSSGVRHLA